MRRRLVWSTDDSLVVNLPDQTRIQQPPRINSKQTHRLLSLANPLHRDNHRDSNHERHDSKDAAHRSRKHLISPPAHMRISTTVTTNALSAQARCNVTRRSGRVIPAGPFFT